MIKRWWLWITVCIPRVHTWMPDPTPDFAAIDPDGFYGWTPSSTCTRCGARSW